MPMAMALELMTEATLAAYPGWTLDSVTNLDIPSGIVIDGGRKDIIIVCQELKRQADRLEIAASIKTPDKVRFRANIELLSTGSRTQKSFIGPPAIEGSVMPLPSVAHAYQN